MVQKLEGDDAKIFADLVIPAYNVHVMYYWPNVYRMDSREVGKYVYVPDYGEKYFHDSIEDFVMDFSKKNPGITKYSVSDKIVYRGPMTGYLVKMYR